MEILQDAIDAGDIVNVGEQYTDNWDPAVAQRNMEQILTDNDNMVDAVVAQNDGTAGGAIAALDAQGLAGVVPVSGQDAEGAALNRIAKGTQTQTVWVDGRTEATAAANIAVALAQGAALDEDRGLSGLRRRPQRRAHQCCAAGSRLGHPGQPRRPCRGRLDQPGRALRRRRGRLDRSLPVVDDP